jgi:hypothetical protein
MSAMLLATVLAGLATSRILAAIGLRIFSIRYALAVIVAYAVFVGSVKLWLLYIGFCAAVAKRRSGSSSGSDWFDCFNFSGGGTSSSSSSSGGGSMFSEGGGKFGGGGASGSWGSPQPNANTMVPAFLSSSKQGSSSSSKSSSKGGGGGGGSDDLGELILVVLIIALVVAVIATFIWLIWAAPAILSEAAFNAVLAGALAKHAHSASHGSWIGSIIKKTRIAFALILVLAILVGWWAQKYCPAANKLSEAVHCVQPAM